VVGFICKRLVWIALTLWAVFTISFFLMHAMPGGPLDRERQLEPEIRANLERRYRLDQPLWAQYGYELARTVRGDLGYPLKLDVSVNEIIRQGFPVSAALGVLALSFAVIVGFSAGVLSAIRRGGPLDALVMAGATLGMALPNFVVAGVLLILFVFVWPVLPAGGWGSARQLILPAVCLGAPYAAYIARLVRTGLLDVLNQDYIRTARAKGVSAWGVITRHALPGALLPVVSYLGPAIAGVLTGSLVIEQIFYIPGLGVHFVQAASQRDYTLAMGIVLLYTALLTTMNLLVDLAYFVLDPRIKLE